MIRKHSGTPDPEIVALLGGYASVIALLLVALAIIVYPYVVVKIAASIVCLMAAGSAVYWFWLYRQLRRGGSVFRKSDKPSEDSKPSNL
jgi:hypothetical protein